MVPTLARRSSTSRWMAKACWKAVDGFVEASRGGRSRRGRAGSSLAVPMPNPSPDRQGLVVMSDGLVKLPQRTVGVTEVACGPTLTHRSPVSRQIARAWL